MFDWLRKWWSRKVPRRVRAVYDSAQTTEENQRHWRWADNLSARTANDLAVRQTLRERARYEVANNSYAKGLVLSLASDFSGLGPKLQILTQDSNFNLKIESFFQHWSKEVGLADKLRVIHQAKKIDGEAFVILTNNTRLNHSVKLDLTLVECDQVTSPRAVLSMPQDNGTINIDGVIIDREGNVVAYEILVDHPGDYYPSYETRVHSPSHICHWFRMDRPGQIRGVSEFASSLPLFAQLRRYTLATLSAAEIAANFALMLETDAPPDGADADPSPMATMEVDRGIMTAVPAGWQAKQLSAEQPTTTYAMFKEELLKEIGRPFSAPQHIVSGSSANYNFSSARMDGLIYRAGIRVERSQAEAKILEPLFRMWFREASLIGIIPKGLKDLPHNWVWPGFDYMDPQVEAAAEFQRLAQGTTTLSEVLAERGLNFEDVVKARAREKQILEKYGLPAPGLLPEHEVEIPSESGTIAARRIVAFDPDQERDEFGRWAENGGSTEKKEKEKTERENATSRREFQKQSRVMEKRKVAYDREDVKVNKARQKEDVKQTQARKKEDQAEARAQKKEDQTREAARKKEDRETASKRKKEDKEIAQIRKKEDKQSPPSRKTIHVRKQADEERSQLRERSDLRKAKIREEEDEAISQSRQQAQTEKAAKRSAEDLEKKKERFEEDRVTQYRRSLGDASEKNRLEEEKKAKLEKVRKRFSSLGSPLIRAYDDDQERDESGRWTSSGGETSSKRDDEDYETSSKRDDEDYAVKSKRDDEDNETSSKREDADIDRRYDRESEDDDITESREKEDQKIASSREKEDQKIASSREKEDQKLASSRTKEDEKIASSREKENDRIEKSREKIKEQLEKKQAKEIDQVSSRHSKEDDALQESWEERGLSQEEQDREFAGMQSRQSKEYDEVVAKHDSQTSEMEKQWSDEDQTRENQQQQEDETLTKLREQEDTARENTRKKEDESLSQSRAQEDQSRSDSRAAADQERQSRRDREDAEIRQHREQEDSERQSQREREDSERQSQREREDSERQSQRDKEDADNLELEVDPEDNLELDLEEEDNLELEVDPEDNLELDLEEEDNLELEVDSEDNLELDTRRENIESEQSREVDDLDLKQSQEEESLLESLVSRGVDEDTQLIELSKLREKHARENALLIEKHNKALEELEKA